MDETQRYVNKLKRQAESQLRIKRTMNTRDQIYVDYFAVTRLIEYYEETKKAANIVIKLRDDLEYVFFTFHPTKNNDET